MKKRILNACILFTIIIAGTISCDKNKTNKVDPTENAKKVLELEARMNALNSGTGKMTNFMSVIGYSQLKEGQLNIDGSGSEPGSPDSTAIDTTNYWAPVTCAKVSESDNEDGTHTTIYDYGDGCDEYGTLFKGKVTYIWKNENNYYYSAVIYDHYYSYGVEMNGTSKYSFTSDGKSSVFICNAQGSADSVSSGMPALFNWSGSSTAHDEITLNYDDGNSTYYHSDYSNVWDSLAFKVLQGEYFVSNKSDGYEYHYLVTQPLITDYTCNASWVPVSGIETITTTQNGSTTDYRLNYGSGTCDNLAELTENGQTTIIDFSVIYQTINGDSTKVIPMSARKGLK